MNQPLPPPALNIEGFYFPISLNDDDCFGGNWTDPRTLQFAFKNYSNRAFCDSGGHGYSLAEVVANGTCQPALEACPHGTEACQIQKYQWGVSFQQATIGAIFTLMWSIGLSVLSLIAYHRLPLADTSETPRGWRAVIHLGETIREDLDHNNLNPDKLMDRELKDRILALSHGGEISFQKPRKNQRGRLGDMLYQQIKITPKWNLRGSFVASFIFGVLIHLRIGGAIISCILLSLIVGQFWAIIFGRDTVARVIIVLLWSLVGIGMGIAVYFTCF